MNNSFFVGKRVSSFDEKNARLPISKVILHLDSQNSIVAGDDTGTVIEQDCPYATQQMADALLEELSGYTYQPFSANGAIIDPLAELGDGITVNGRYGVLGYQKIHFASVELCDISAPGAGEVLNEYVVGGYNEVKIDREIKKVGSAIAKTAEEIRMEVGKLEESVNGKFESYSTRTQTSDMISEEIRKLEESINGTLKESYSTRTQTAEQIRDAVTGLVDGDYVSSSITTALDGLALEASSTNGTTVLKLMGGEAVLSTKELKLSVDAAYITGTLTIGQLPNDVAKKSDIPDTSDFALSEDVPERLGDLINAAADVTTIVKGTVTAKYINAMAITAAYVSADGITAGTLDASFLALDGLLELKNGAYRGYVGVNSDKGGAVLSSEDMNVFVIANDSAAKLSYWEQNKIWVHSGGCYSSETIQIYSDRTMKDNINYDLTVEEKIFAGLRPCSFEYISDKSRKKHWGFIAQDFIGNAQGLGVDTDKLAVLGEYEGKYSIGYGEITALNTHMIQRLMRRVAALESRLEE